MNVRETCAACGRTFPPRRGKRFCDGLCRSRNARFPEELRTVLNVAIERLAAHGNDDQWGTFMAFAATATLDEWEAVADGLKEER